MERPVPPSRPSPGWLAAGVAAVAVVAWLAGTIDRGPTDPLPVTGDIGAGLRAADHLDEAEAFWVALGEGDLEAVTALLEPDPAPALTHYAGFTATFAAGYEPQACRAVTDDTVRCTVAARNAELVDLYWLRSQTTGYVGAGTVTFGGGGITGFHEPGLITTATARLVAAAVEADGAMPDACDRLHHDAADLPPINTTLALTAACAAALLPHLPAAIASQG